MSDRRVYDKRYTKLFLIQKLQEAGEMLGRQPFAKDMSTLTGFPSIATYVKHFGSWNNASKIAGYSPRAVGNTVVSKIKELTEGDAKYVACAIDTDGFISIHGRSYGKKEYDISVGVSNTHVGFLRGIQKIVGGGRLCHRSQSKASFKTTKERYELNFRRNEARDLLPQLVPFLVIKKKRAVRALKLLNRVR